MEKSAPAWRRFAVIAGTVLLLMIMAGFGVASARTGFFGYGGYGYGGYGPGCGYGGYCPPPPCGYSDYCPPPPTFGECAKTDNKGAVISNGTVQLGVCKLGDLNVPDGGPPSNETHTTTVGLRYQPTNNDATAPGCECEGWGAGDATSNVSGYANQSRGTNGLTPISFSSTATTAVSKVAVGSTLEVTQNYHPSDATRNLFEATVTIKNVSPNPVSPRYRRVMDWDVEPTAFEDFVTINPGTAAALLFSSDDGFGSADPFGPRTQIDFTGAATDSGPNDHGALFDFGFDTLAPGASRTFAIYYGAAATETEALAAVSAVGAEVYSLGQPNTEHGPDQGTPNTFIFAFAGVGGQSIKTPLSLEPTSALKTVGETHHVTATLRNESGGPLANKTLRWSVTGANPKTSQSVTTNSDGKAAIEWVGNSAGKDDLTVFGDLNGNGSRDSNEPQAFASANWDAVQVVSDPTTGTVLGGGGGVTVGHYTNPTTGLDYFTVPRAAATGTCLQLPMTFTINPGAGTLSNVNLIIRKPDGTQDLVALSNTPGTNQWQGTIPCLYTATLELEYDLTEGSTTQHFVVPVGGIVLIDPAGIVYDKHAYDLARCTGKSSADAMKSAAISGASVKLQRSSGGSFSDVLSGDPGIAPNVNPEVTGADGRYQWDVSAGSYRVVVSKSGYGTVTSSAVTIPPPITDLHIALLKNGDPATTTCDSGGGDTGGGDSGGGDGGGGTTTTPGVTPPPPVGSTNNPPVTRPPVKCKVPKLKGKTLAKAKKLLTAAHCKLGKVSKKAGKKKNVVVSSKPAAGKSLKAGTKVAVVVGSGRKR